RARPGEEGDRRFAIAEADRRAAPAEQAARQRRETAAVACPGCGVEHEVEFAEVGQVVEVARMYPAWLAELIDQRIGARWRAVDDEQVADAGVEERWCDAARRATGSEQQG